MERPQRLSNFPRCLQNSRRLLVVVVDEGRDSCLREENLVNLTEDVLVGEVSFEEVGLDVLDGAELREGTRQRGQLDASKNLRRSNLTTYRSRS